jgi:hypothetical protein
VSDPFACPYETARRILVIGDAPSVKGVDAIPWAELRTRTVSVADYNTLILNLLGISGSRDGQLPPLHHLPQIGDFGHLLFSEESEILVLGNPSLRIGSFFSPWWWWPILFPTEVRSGTEVVGVDPRFAYLYQPGWHWGAYFTGSQLLSKQADTFGRAVAPGVSLTIETSSKPLASTRFDKALGLEVQFKLMRADGALHRTSGPVFWVPYFVEQDSKLAVGAVLRRRYGVVGGQAAPEWVASFTLPKLDPILAHIEQLEASIDSMSADLTESKERALEVGRFRRLLYETGDALEEVVRDALADLGGDVTIPEAGREDAQVRSPQEHEFVVEIKGRRGALKRADVRQLGEWILRAEEAHAEGWAGTGLLIHNAFSGDAPAERGDPYANQTLEFAKRLGLTLMTTTQLFQALCDVQVGRLTADQFWEAAATGSGPAPLPELAPGAGGKQRELSRD